MVKDKYLADLLVVTQPLEAAIIQLMPSATDRLSGVLVRTALGLVAPRALRRLDQLGVAPGMPIKPKAD